MRNGIKMKELSDLTKYLGIPSLATLALSGFFMWHYGTVKNRYIEEISRTVPIVRSVDRLDNAYDDLAAAEGSLRDCGQTTTHPMSFPFFINGIPYYLPHLPQSSHRYANIDDALDKLNSARNNIASGNFSDNHEVRTLDNQIRLLQKELNRTKRGEPGAFYNPQRTQIRELQVRAFSELISLRKEVPPYILKKSDSLKNPPTWIYGTGYILGFLGVAGVIFYGFAKHNE